MGAESRAEMRCSSTLRALNYRDAVEFCRKTCSNSRKHRTGKEELGQGRAAFNVQRFCTEEQKSETLLKSSEAQRSKSTKRERLLCRSQIIQRK